MNPRKRRKPGKKPYTFDDLINDAAKSFISAGNREYYHYFFISYIRRQFQSEVLEEHLTIENLDACIKELHGNKKWNAPSISYVWKYFAAIGGGLELIKAMQDTYVNNDRDFIIKHFEKVYASNLDDHLQTRTPLGIEADFIKKTKTHFAKYSVNGISEEDAEFLEWWLDFLDEKAESAPSRRAMLAARKPSQHKDFNPNHWNEDCYNLFKYIAENYENKNSKKFAYIWHFLHELKGSKYDIRCRRGEYVQFVANTENVTLTNFDKPTRITYRKIMDTLHAIQDNFEAQTRQVD